LLLLAGLPSGCISCQSAVPFRRVNRSSEPAAAAATGLQAANGSEISCKHLKKCVVGFDEVAAWYGVGCKGGR
jgi:hypothetical protein